ncbi:MAG: (d)CMP kinase [Oscillospiraceae bacterium]|jgi:cytidylate kinase|nr:(d)CMP kinase [Oscillospiraceae bacterium]
METRSIAIDGPSGAGKSTLAKMAAKRLGMIYVDTGALYRSIGLYALRNGVGSKDERGVERLLPEITLEMCYDGAGTQRVILRGEDVTDEIRAPEVSIYASDVSAMPPVREFLLQMQRDMAVRYDVIMDGRDIGTVVLPSAGVKIFLTADPEIRARRRFDEMVAAGRSAEYEEVLRDINYRDVNDSSRAAAPLKPSEDAITVDTSPFGLDESFEKVLEIIEARLKSGAK